MDKLYWLNQIKPQDRAKVGEKAFNLSRIMQRGYPVVPGFVISAGVLQEFLENLNSSEALVADLPYSYLHLDVNNWRELQKVASRLRQEITSASLSKKWVSKIVEAAGEWDAKCLIFRPSLEVLTSKKQLGNISGLLESQICRCEEDAVDIALKRTWSQLFRAKSLLFWQRAGIDLQEINLAVLVQPIQNVVKSGLLNSLSSVCHIQATWGLGLGITYGDILPDSYYIQRESGIVFEQQLGNKMLAYACEDTDHWASLQQLPILQEQTGVIAYLLNESQQQNYCLQQKNLQKIIDYANQFANELGANFTFKWVISEKNLAQELYITQISTPQPQINHTYFLKGLEAAGGCVIATAYTIVNPQQKPEDLPAGVILVAPAIGPDWLGIIKNAAGIITEQGGLTSHAAILARELRIPAVVNVVNATKLIQSGEQLLVDGDKGEIHRVSGESHVMPLSTDVTHKVSTSHQQSLTATQLFVNLSQSSMIEEAVSLPVDGVGLLRSELMALSILEGKHPNSWLLDRQGAQLRELWCKQIMLFASAFAPRLIFYRSLDWLRHELPSDTHNLQSLGQSLGQTLLGDRGTFSYLKNPAVFELELAAIKAVQEAGYKNIHLLLPFVRTVEEFKFCRQKVEQAGLTEVSEFQLWIMAEVPSVLFLLPEYIKAGVQGISIGTNDLTQLLLGVDREQGHLAKVFNERHPAVMGAIAQLIQMANQFGIPCSICGQAPALYPEIIEDLVRWGITSISVEPEAVSRTHQALARAEQRILLEAARRQINS